MLCRWYRDDFDRLFEDVDMVLNKRDSHCHNVFHNLDEDTYQMSSATTHQKAMMGAPREHKKLHEKHSLKGLQEVVERTSECISRLEGLMATPPKGPILMSHFLKLPEEERLKTARPSGNAVEVLPWERKNPAEDRRRRICEHLQFRANPAQGEYTSSATKRDFTTSESRAMFCVDWKITTMARAVGRSRVDLGSLSGRALF